MPPYPDKFISLDRTFHELTLADGADDDTVMSRDWGTSTPLRWDELQEPRVVILSEAGA